MLMNYKVIIENTFLLFFFGLLLGGFLCDVFALTVLAVAEVGFLPVLVCSSSNVTLTKGYGAC